MELFLTAISGLAWTIVYIDSIRIGFRQKTYAMPMAALGLNFAWESTYAVHDLTTVVSVQGLVNLAWALADLAIVYTFVKFGRAEFPRFVTRTMFTFWGILVFGASYAVQWLFLAEFGAHDASRYSAFLQNLLMAGLFIAMLVARRGLRGQTLTIAIAKWLGTLAPTILFGAIQNSPFILGLGILCSVFDLVYIGLAVWEKTHPGALAAADTASGRGLPASPPRQRSLGRRVPPAVATAVGSLLLVAAIVRPDIPLEALLPEYLLLAAAEEAAVPMPMASRVHDRFVAALAHGLGEADWAAIARISYQNAGL